MNPWADKEKRFTSASKYHYALLGWYGLIEYLKANHIMDKSSVSVANFSDDTIIGRGLDEAKRRALNPQFGNTYIDLKKVQTLFKGYNNLVFTISDGDIANWSTEYGTDEKGKKVVLKKGIGEDFIRTVKQNNHQYFHLQIGQKNKTCRDLEKEGLKVEYISSAQDLATKVIDLTDKLYRASKSGPGGM